MAKALTLTVRLANAMEKIAQLELAIAQREETISNQDDELESVLIENRALQARLVVVATVYRDQRAKIGELEAALNTRGTKPAPAQRPVYQPQPPTAETLAWRAYSAEQAAAAKDSGKCLKSMSRTEFGAWYAEQAVMPETA